MSSGLDFGGGASSNSDAEECDDCEEIYKAIDVAVNGLERRWLQIRENKDGIDPKAHQIQFEQRQKNLRRLLNDENTKGCIRYKADAWDWATISTPSPQ